MEIVVAKGTGCGHTPLSAFDAALHDAGVANYNLLPLSSVIPPGSRIIERKFTPPLLVDEWGHRLYVVMARNSTMIPGTEAWAGIGWVQAPDGRGLFVEHYDASRENVLDMIHASLADMVDYRDCEFGEVYCALQGGKCVDRPVSALVVAVYQSEDWHHSAELSVLAISKRARGQGHAFLPLAAEMWRCCTLAGVSTLWAELEPRMVRAYARFGWPFEIAGELREFWGDPLYPCRMDMEAARDEFVIRARTSSLYARAVEQAFRVSPSP